MSTLNLDFLRRYVLGDKRDSMPVAYQYDQGHVLEINIPTEVTSAEIHYSQTGMAGADAYEPENIEQESDGTYTITANVPNKLFENGSNINVYVVVTDDDAAITTYQGRIPVVMRGKPGDYVDDNPDNSAAKIMSIEFTDPNEDGNIVVTIS